MKECNNIMLYSSGELESAERTAFKVHLAHCPACQAELAFLNRTEEALAAPSAPATVVDALLAKTTRKKSFLAGWKPALAGGAVLGLGVLMVWAGLQPDKAALDTREVIAYMSENLDEEYLAFADDLDAFEQDF